MQVGGLPRAPHIVSEVNAVHNYHFSIRVEKNTDGYAAFCSELPGCYAQGDTYELAIEAIRDAIRLHVEDRLANGEEIPQAESVSLTSLDIAV